MNFDAVAPFYRPLETLVFARSLQRARSAFLDEVAGCERALIAGQGDGRFVHALLLRNPQICVTCIDTSRAMIARARQRLDAEQLARAEFLRADLLETEATPPCHDLVVTNFFLDCFTADELAQVIDKLARSACARAAWLVAEFHVPHAGLPHVAAQALVALMYLFFRLTTGSSASELPQHDRLLESCGFRRVRTAEFYFGMVRAELWRR